MKRIFLLFISLIILHTAAVADNDHMITVGQLPQKAQKFIQAHFSDVKVSYAKMESDVFDKSYEVVFVNGYKVEFNKKGDWTDVDCKFANIPEGAIPQKIRDYIAANHPGQKVIEMDRDTHDIEVKLDNRIELRFNLKYDFIGFDL